MADITSQSAQRLSQSNKKRLSLLKTRPDPPRGAKYQDGVVTWEEPKELSNVTHYNIYLNNENNLVQRVPKGQTTTTGLSGQRVFISSYNENSGLDSTKSLLDQVVTPADSVTAVTVRFRYDMVVTGPLFVKTGLLPPFVIPGNSSINRVWAAIGSLPTGTTTALSTVSIDVTQDGTLLCSLSLDQTSTSGLSAEVDGSTLAQLNAGSILNMNITSVGNVTPGSNLAVFIEVSVEM